MSEIQLSISTSHWSQVVPIWNKMIEPTITLIKNAFELPKYKNWL